MQITESPRNVHIVHMGLARAPEIYILAQLSTKMSHLFYLSISYLLHTCNGHVQILPFFPTFSFNFCQLDPSSE